jgi:acetate---CoA ligase (ADP-forming)
MTSPPYRLDDLVRARSVAVVGASQDPTRIGGRPIAFLQQAGFTGPIYPVNAKYAEVQGLRAYPDLEAIPGPVEVAIVSVPARDVPGVIEACAKKGVRAAVVFSSGFGEVGEEGRAQQAALERLARVTGVRIVGPNCQGVVALHHRLNLSFSSAFLDWGEPGHVGLAVQSGAVGGMMAALLRERRVGFSHWVSAGNEADVDVAECIDFFARDPATRVIGAYVESIRDGRRLLDAVVAARAAGKPVVILRTGRSAQSRRAAASHTGALASDDAVATALLAQAGATDVRDVTELLDALATFARVAPPRGRRLGILSNSGGLGVIMADTAARLGLELPAFSTALQQELAAILPAFGATGNPVDVTAQLLADATLLPRSLRAMLGSSEVDLLIVALAMVNRLYPVQTIVDDIVGASRETGKSVIVTWLASAPEALHVIEAAGLPVFTDATRCLTALSALLRFAGEPPLLEGPVASAPTLPAEARRLLERMVPHARHEHADTGASAGLRGEHPDVSPDDEAASLVTLDEFDSKAVLRAAGVPTVEERLVAMGEDAARAAESLGYPVALKLCAAGIPHKSEHGLVKLGLRDAAAVRAAAAELNAIHRRLSETPRRDVSTARTLAAAPAVRGLLVQPMVPPGIEMVIGSRRDPTFGPVVMVGLGGLFVEHFADVAFGLAPVTRVQARAMLRSLRAWPLLAGARGRPPADVDAIADVLIALSRLALAGQAFIREIDVNPLIALASGVVAADGLVVVDAPAPGVPLPPHGIPTPPGAASGRV